MSECSSPSTLPLFLTFPKITALLNSIGQKFYTRSYLSKLMKRGDFPRPASDANHKPYFWRREDVLAWLKTARGIDASDI